MLAQMLDLIFPPRCSVCRDFSKEALCPNCSGQIQFMKPQMGIHAMAIYEGVVKTAIHQFKFKKKKKLAEPLGLLLARYVTSNGLDLKEIDLVAAVPLHPRRKRERGFNQSELLARVFARYCRLPVGENVLSRIRNTHPQFNLVREARRENVAGAFAAAHVHRKNILLIDDIYTTGSTIAECGRALKAAGAGKVEVLTLSRAVL